MGLIIQCGSAKLDTPAKARELYTGGLFVTNRNYALFAYPNDWLILSAFYGLVHPETVLAPYDFKMKKIDPKFVAYIVQQANGATGYDFLGSNLYFDALKEAGIASTKLLADIKLPGNKQKYLNHAIQNNMRAEDITENLVAPSITDDDALLLIYRYREKAKGAILNTLRKAHGGISATRFARLYKALNEEL